MIFSTRLSRITPPLKQTIKMCIVNAMGFHCETKEIEYVWFIFVLPLQGNYLLDIWIPFYCMHRILECMRCVWGYLTHEYCIICLFFFFYRGIQNSMTNEGKKKNGQAINKKLFIYSLFFMHTFCSIMNLNCSFLQHSSKPDPTIQPISKIQWETIDWMQCNVSATCQFLHKIHSHAYNLLENSMCREWQRRSSTNSPFSRQKNKRKKKRNSMTSST